MDKQTEHLSFRLTPELKLQIEAIALARGVSVSTLCNQSLSETVDRERRLYLELSRAFAGALGLPSGQGGQEQAA